MIRMAWTGENQGLVRVERLELPRLSAPEPKSGVSTNFTIPAKRRAPRQAGTDFSRALYTIVIAGFKGHSRKKGVETNRHLFSSLTALRYQISMLFPI